MRREHPETLSVQMLRRRIPRLKGREAAILVEMTKVLVGRNGRRYVER